MTEQIIINNIENYIQEIINGNLVLTPKKKYLTENELNMSDISGSKIEECLVESQTDTVSTSTTYRRILIDIWKTMPTQLILQTTAHNFKLTNENGTKGYNWCSDINMSFQSKAAKDSLKEIINMVKLNKMTLNIAIKLENGKLVYLKID